MKSRWLLVLLVVGMLSLNAPLTVMAGNPQQAPKGAQGWYCPPPRFQIFDAPKPYGGLMMVDTRTGDTWQRIKVNTTKGIRIRWIKVPRVDELPQGHTILWD